MPDNINWFQKLMEHGKECMSCFPLIASMTQRQVEEVGKYKWLLAQSLQAVLIVVPILVTIGVYGGRMVEKLDAQAEATMKNTRATIENTVTTKNNTSKLEAVRKVQIEFDKTLDGAAKDIVNVNLRLDKLEDN